MTNEKDSDGNLLSDEIRLTKFGKFLRVSSLDELPQLFNILKGDMSIVGPRPQLIIDMWFINEEERKRHLAKPGLTGLAQVNGRNNTTWEERLNYDLKYIEKITFISDLAIFFKTIIKVLKREGVSTKDNNDTTSIKYGEFLVKTNRISKDYYEEIITKNLNKK